MTDDLDKNNTGGEMAPSPCDPSYGRRSEGALWYFLYKATNHNHEGPPPNTITLGIRL